MHFFYQSADSKAWALSKGPGACCGAKEFTDPVLFWALVLGLLLGCLPCAVGLPAGAAFCCLLYQVPPVLYQQMSLYPCVFMCPACATCALPTKHLRTQAPPRVP
jgi:hypothetical protein